MVGISRRHFDASRWRRLTARAGKVAQLPDRPGYERRLPPDTDALLVDLGVAVGRRQLAALPNLGYVGVFGTGFEAVDTPAAASRGVSVTNIPGYATEAVAEFAVMAALREMRASGRGAPGRELKGRPVGIVGLGRIGRRFADIARDGFGADVAFWSRSPKPAAGQAGLTRLPLKQLLSRSDLISVHLALNADTEGLLDASHIASIRRGAVVVCLSPLDLFEPQALHGALRRGAFSLVSDHGDSLSPARLRALRALPSVRFVRPVANMTDESNQARQETFVRNFERFAAGRPTNLVNAPRSRRGTNR